MNRAHKLAFIACIFWVCVVGCGVNPTSIPPENGPCTGVLISGILKDSLTGYPVAQGQVFLESGSQVSIIKLYNFVPIKQVTTKHDGTFQICVSSLGSPSVIVAAALDSSNYAYPPFV